MARIGIGQRVQVIDGGLTQYKQFGTVVAAGTSSSLFVLLDNADESNMQTFFHSEELQSMEPDTIQLDQTLQVVEDASS